MGWDKFSFSIIEECSSIKIQIEKENKYLQEYLPLLNTSTVNNSTNIIVYESLYEELKIKQKNLEFLNKKYKGVPIYVYKFTENNIEKDNTYDSINNLNKIIEACSFGVSRATIKIYLNTNVPYKELLFYTNPLDNLILTHKEVKKSNKRFKIK